VPYPGSVPPDAVFPGDASGRPSSGRPPARRWAATRRPGSATCSLATY
jgi:hypothetical protein